MCPVSGQLMSQKHLNLAAGTEYAPKAVRVGLVEEVHHDACLGGRVAYDVCQHLLPPGYPLAWVVLSRPAHTADHTAES